MATASHPTSWSLPWADAEQDWWVTPGGPAKEPGCVGSPGKHRAHPLWQAPEPSHHEFYSDPKAEAIHSTTPTCVTVLGPPLLPMAVAFGASR
jgi:hypothetical protein